MPEERRNERLARRVVAHALSCVVERYEDGSRDSQVDAEIVLPDGRAGLEVVADIDPAVPSMWKALENVQHEVRVEGLARRWIVTLRRTASVKRAVAELPGFMLQLERGELQTHRSAVPSELEKLGVVSADPILNDDRPGGRIHLSMEGWSGSAGMRPEVAPWVADMLERHPDVPRKLQAHPSSEGHAFLWVTTSSDFETQSALENRGQALPAVEPVLPNGVTHVWVAGLSSSQGVLAWFPHRGWWRTPWSWPASAADLAVLLED